MSETMLRVGREVTVRIESLGGHGDGIAVVDGMTLFVPMTVPGDRVVARITAIDKDRVRARAVELLEASDERVEPTCSYFGPCGGCSAQHLSDDLYHRWKRDGLVRLLERNGFDTACVQPMAAGRGAERRRVTWKLRAPRNRAILGYFEAGTHHIVDIDHCPLVVSELEALIEPVKTFIGTYDDPTALREVQATRCEGGVDLLFRLEREPGAMALQDFASFADQQDLARVSWVGIKARTAPEIVVERRPVKIRCGGVLVDLPPGGFAQASDSGHAALERGVMEALGPIARLAGRIADLYSGAGTFTFPMVEAGARVHAVEGDGVALDALGRAANAHNLADAVTMERRDLARWPLTAEELSAFDGIVFDPPRGGAKAQAAEIAQSSVPVVVAVSCNPVTFARDARLLADGGYRLDSVTPVDQFHWSRHLELVAVFRKTAEA